MGCSCTQPKASSPVNLPPSVAVRTEENHPSAWGAVSSQQVGDTVMVTARSSGSSVWVIREEAEVEGERECQGGTMGRWPGEDRRGSEKGGGESRREDRGKEEEGQGRVPSSK